MKVLIVLSAMFAAVLGMPSGAYIGYPQYQAQAINTYARPAAQLISRPIVTGQMYSSQDTAGQYKFGYTSSDGQAKDEIKEGNGDVSGSFSYTSPEGQAVKLSYTAGEEGFKAEGDHLPQAPELPAELAAAYDEAHETLRKAHEEARLRGDVEPEDNRYDDGSYRGEEEHEQRVTYQAPIHQTYVQAPQVFAVKPRPVTYVSAPARPITYVSAPARPVTYVSAPSRPVISAPSAYVSSSYQTVLGGVSAPAPAPVTLVHSAPAVLPGHGHKKSGQTLGY